MTVPKYFYFRVNTLNKGTTIELKNASNVDVVEVVRCKDCKHHWTHKSMDSMPIERCDLEQTFYDAEHDFCSLAERKENG